MTQNTIILNLVDPICFTIVYDICQSRAKNEAFYDMWQSQGKNKALIVEHKEL